MFVCSSKVTMLVSVVLMTVSCHAAPADDTKSPEIGNLKYTFGSNEEIPAAFFESAPPKKISQPSSSQTTNQTAKAERPVYPPCQDGSGGMCVNFGTCPSDLKPETNAPGTCSNGQECCFGAPINDKSCSSRGGECVPTKDCGSAPKFLEAEDCDQKNGQVCCIYV